MKIHEAMAPRRAITEEEIETYSRDGVVCLRGVLSRDSIKSIEDAIETATASLDQSYGGYNLTAIGCHRQRRPGDAESPVGQAV